MKDGKSEKPLVVIQSWSRSVSFTDRSRYFDVTGVRTFSHRDNIAGNPSPICPTINRSLRCRANVPETARRSTWSAVSACQPQPFVDRMNPTCSGRSEKGVVDSARWKARMQVERHVQRLGTRQQGRESSVVEKLSVHDTVQHRPAKSEVANCPLQFVRCSLRISHRQVRESSEPSRVSSDGRCKRIVQITRVPDGVRTMEQFGTRTGR